MGGGRVLVQKEAGTRHFGTEVMEILYFLHEEGDEYDDCLYDGERIFLVKRKGETNYAICQGFREGTEMDPGGGGMGGG